MDMKGAIAALDRALALEAAGKAENMVKTHAIWGGHHTLHAIGATFPDEGFVGTKTWAHANGAAPLLILFDSHNGSLKAIIEAFALGQLRTGGISGLATKYLAADGACDMALIGTGKQAMTQLAAVASVRPLRRVRAYSRDGAARAELDRATLDELGAESEGGDETDRLTVAAIRERLGLALELYEAGEDERDLNVIASAPQNVRSVFDLMDAATPEGWQTITTRLGAVPAALAGYTESLRLAASRGHVAARRQLEKVADECEEFAGEDGFFATFVADAPAADLGPAAQSDLQNVGTAVPRRTRRWPTSSGPSSSRKRPRRTPSAATVTPSPRASSSAPRWTWTRPISGVWRSWGASRPRWPRWPTRSSPVVTSMPR
jgi:hypothetical protein